MKREPRQQTRMSIPMQRPNQVIVSGPVDQLRELIKHLENPDRPDRQDRPDPYVIRRLGGFERTTSGYAAILVRLLLPVDDTCDRTKELNQQLLQVAREQKLDKVKTEPNCTTGNRKPTAGNPFAWEGNAFASPQGEPIVSWEGDPFISPDGEPIVSWEGDPLSQGTKGSQKIQQVVPEGKSAAKGYDAFAEQDAFARMRVAAHGKRRPQLAHHLGEGVRVGIFDTCPSEQKLAALPMAPLTWLHPHWASPALAGGEFTDHGLFIASLINFIAPAAEIHLYEVLEGTTYGDTARLIEALTEFIDAADPRPAVINLSLGSMCGCGGGRMPAVEGLLWRAVQKGMVICAAAGNGGLSARKTATIPPAQMPASLPYVIAVAASNREDVRASYSHRGDIAAPGGEALGRPGPGDRDDVIGLGTVSVKSGYVRMDAGTSFSTPLVAGVAALVLEDLVKRGAPRDSGLWRRVMQRLELGCIAPNGAPGTLNTTGLGAGIVRVLERNVLPGC